MTELLARIEDQDDFPLSDLTPNNRDFLSLMLANNDFMRRGHRLAESSYPIFIEAHASLFVGARNIFPDEQNALDFHYGVKAFEAITLFVNALRAQPDALIMPKNIDTVRDPDNAERVREYFEEAIDIFRSEMPNTVAVITEVTERRVSSAHIAVLGGAAARKFEIDNAENIN